MDKRHKEKIREALLQSWKRRRAAKAKEKEETHYCLCGERIIMVDGSPICSRHLNELIERAKDNGY